jgi:hypothetical protein
MAIPVVASRIQNRRGTQDNFNGPAGGIYPPDYDGNGGYNPPGTGPIGFTPQAYPNVLLPGELAVCIDSLRVFIGVGPGPGPSGKFVELLVSAGADTFSLVPLVLVLPPVTVFTAITGLNYMPSTSTPFFTIFYDLTDHLGDSWDEPGTLFSRNGSMQITAVKYVATPPAATLTDSGTEINKTANSISFIAEYDPTGVFIQIKYKHSFPTSLTFSSRSLHWQPF